MKRNRTKTHGTGFEVWRWLSRHWPLFIWIAAVVVAAWLYSRTSRIRGMQGVAETLEDVIAPLETAKLAELYIQVGDVVQAGDPIARMDTTLLEARMAIEDARLLEAEHSITGYQRDVARMMQNFAESQRTAERALASERAALQRDQAKLAALRDEYSRREDLRRRNLIRESELASLRPDIAALEASIATRPQLIALHTDRVATLRSDQEQLRGWLQIDDANSFADAVVEALDARATMLSARAERRQLQKEVYTLYATRDGVVSRVYHNPGSVVSGGDPIALLVPETTRTVIGFLPEHYQGQIEWDQGVYVSRVSGEGRVMGASMQAIAPEVRSLPVRVNPIRNEPLRGRRVVLELTDENDWLVPGESVRISIPLRWEWLGFAR